MDMICSDNCLKMGVCLLIGIFGAIDVWYIVAIRVVRTKFLGVFLSIGIVLKNDLGDCLPVGIALNKLISSD